jgi:hypothetical protein
MPNTSASNLTKPRLKPGLLIFNLGIWAILLINGLLPMLNMAEESWHYPDFVPFIKPIGTDFREGYFYPAKVLLQGKSPYVDYKFNYPPFSALFSVPFRLFQVDTAYLIDVCLLFALNIASVILGLSIAQHVFAPSVKGDESDDWHPAVYRNLLPQLAVYAVTCYGFLFSVERGNMDSFPLFFLLLALWLLARTSTSNKELWIATVLIGIAAHLKVYPAALFILVIWKYGRKSLLPILLVNLGLFFSTGITNALQYAQRFNSIIGNAYIWVGNHSAVSFAHYVNSYLGEHLGLQLPSLLFYLLPLTFWAVGAWKLWRKGISPTNMTWLFLLTVPLMSVIPTVSHDYKLVLLTPVIAMLLFWVLIEAGTGAIILRPDRFILLLALLLLLFIIGRTPVLLPTLLKNKYPLILAVQFITLIGMYKQTSSAPTG